MTHLLDMFQSFPTGNVAMHAYRQLQSPRKKELDGIVFWFDGKEILREEMLHKIFYNLLETCQP